MPIDILQLRKRVETTSGKECGVRNYIQSGSGCGASYHNAASLISQKAEKST